MGPRKRSRAPKGLVWRVGRAYFDRRHSRFKGGRLAISLRTGDQDVATERHTVLTQLMDRGDWNVLEAIRRGDMHITDAQAALRNGDATKLRRMGSDSPRLGPAIERFLRLKEATRSRATIKKYRTVLGNLERDRLGLPYGRADGRRGARVPARPESGHGGASVGTCQPRGLPGRVRGTLEHGHGRGGRSARSPQRTARDP